MSEYRIVTHHKYSHQKKTTSSGPIKAPSSRLVPVYAAKKLGWPMIYAIPSDLERGEKPHGFWVTRWVLAPRYVREPINIWLNYLLAQPPTTEDDTLWLS